MCGRYVSPDTAAAAAGSLGEVHSRMPVALPIAA
jgi:hypothetical protein